MSPHHPSLVITAAILLGFDVVKFCVLLLAIAQVIVAEMLNSAIEFSLDSYYHNRYSRMVGMAKDISAGAVMLSTIISVVIGCLIFGYAAAVIFRMLCFAGASGCVKGSSNDGAVLQES